MSEMAQTADHVIVLGRGKVLADATLPDLVRSWTTARVRLRSPRAAELADLLGGLASSTGGAVEVTTAAPDTLDVTGVEAARIGDLAAERGLPLHELTPTTGSLEDAYLALTGESVEYRTRDVETPANSNQELS
jgi:ABC-2 type transport system ATP-binding protein